MQQSMIRIVLTQNERRIIRLAAVHVMHVHTEWKRTSECTFGTDTMKELPVQMFAPVRVEMHLSVSLHRL